MRAFDRRAWMAAIVGGLLAGLVATPFFGQGLDMVDEGRWLLGAHLVVGGEDLHSMIDGGGSGLREHAVAVWMRMFGDDATSFASIRGVGFAIAAGAVTGLGAVAGGIVGAVALFLAALASLPLTPSVGLAWIAAGVAVAFGERALQLRATLIGAAAGAVFLLDPRTFGLMLVPLGVLLLRLPSWRRHFVTVIAGTGSVVSVAAVLAAVSAAPGAALHATFVAPIADAAAAIDPARVIDTARDGAWLDQPFAGLRDTGETWTDLWPGHGTTRATALRLIALAAPLIVVAAAAARAHGRRRGVVESALVVGIVAVLGLVLRGDVPSLRTTAMAVTLAVVLLAGHGRARIGTLIAALVCLPLAAEPIWLSTNADRPNLTRVEGIAFDTARAHRLDSARTVLRTRPEEPVLIWPELPGLHWLLRTRPAAASLDVPDDEDTDRRTAEALRRRAPRFVLFGFSRPLLGHSLHAAAPESWNYLRENYRLRGRVLDGDEDLRVLTPVGAGDPAFEGMAYELPTVELTVANDVSPALREDFTVGQGFRSGPRDIEGFAFRARTSGTNVDLRMRVNVWEWQNDMYRTLHSSEVVETTIAGDRQVVFIEYPLDDTANKDLAITMEAIGTPAAEVRLDWRSDDDPREPGDLYPEGDAILGLTPVDADLYFLLY